MKKYFLRWNQKHFSGSAKSRGLRGNVGYVGVWVARVKCLRGLHGLRGSKYFLRGSSFYVGCNFYVGCVGQTFFARVQIFLRGSFRGSKVFAWVQQFLLGSIFGGESKKNLDWPFHKYLSCLLNPHSRCMEL